MGKRKINELRDANRPPGSGGSLGVPCEGRGGRAGGCDLEPPSPPSSGSRWCWGSRLRCGVTQAKTGVGRGGLNPELAAARSWHRRLPRRLCQQQPGARAALCFLTAFMNFNGQLLLDFSSSRCFPAPRSPSGRPFPSPGLLRLSASSEPPQTLPSVPLVAPTERICPHGARVFAALPGGSGHPGGFSRNSTDPETPETPLQSHPSLLAAG